MKFVDRRFLTDLLVEASCVALLVTVALMCAIHLQDFELREWGSVRRAVTLISLTPVLLMYVLARFVLHALPASLILGSTVALLSKASQIKTSLVNEPVSWTDLASTANLSIIREYAGPSHLAIVLVLAVAWVIAIRLGGSRHRRRSSRLARLAKVIALGIVSPVALHPYIDGLDHGDAAHAEGIITAGTITYLSWNPTENVRKNGLPLHLVQTSRRRTLQATSELERRDFETLTASLPESTSLPRQIIYILCESCWHDDHHFREQFAALRARGMQEFRAISPVYGGLTVNASFEILTGLPSEGQLDGVIYQEYSDLLAPATLAYPALLKRLGYTTIAGHNHYKAFWRRDQIKPKLGFDEFFGLDDMHYKGPVFADDSILFDLARRRIDQASGRKFLFLTTAYTHGDYPFRNDFGEADYTRRLSRTINEIAAFIDSALEQEPDSLILVFGDHKPALNRYFYEHGVFPKDRFARIGKQNSDFRLSPTLSRALRGDVPAFIYHPDTVRIEQIARIANSKPFYCLSQILDEGFTQAGVPAFAFAARKRLCRDFDPEDYESHAARYPQWLYSLSLFEHAPQTALAESRQRPPWCPGAHSESVDRAARGTESNPNDCLVLPPAQGKPSAPQSPLGPDA